MQNILSLKKEFVLLITGLLLVLLALFGNISKLVVSTHNSESAQTTPTPTPDPSKDFKTLDTFITYTLPGSWQKSDHLDKAGIDTYIKLTSPDLNSSESAGIQNGIGIIVDRTYDLKSEDSLKAKLNAVYDFDTYNVTSIKINEKPAMTMHQDKNGHHRLIYIATKTHLWEITITSKSLEDEQKYQGDINTFLNSIKFN